MSLSRIFPPLVENFLVRQNGGDTGRRIDFLWNTEFTRLVAILVMQSIVSSYFEAVKMG